MSPLESTLITLQPEGIALRFTQTPGLPTTRPDDFTPQGIGAMANAGYSFEELDIDNDRIDQLLVTRVPA